MSKEKNADTGHSFKDYFKRATSQLVVLQLLSESPMYAYQMSTELAKRSKNRYTMPILYPVLYRLQMLGYVEEVKKEISEDNRVRNYYGITDRGREYLSKVKIEYCEMIDTMISFIGECDSGKKI